MSDPCDSLRQRVAFASRSVQRLKAEGLTLDAAVQQAADEILPTLTDDERHELASRELVHVMGHMRRREDRGESRDKAIRDGKKDASACEGGDLCPVEDTA